MRSRIDSSKPRMSAVMPTIDVMPMTTPSTVSAERILLVRTVSNAITITSLKRPTRIAMISVPSARYPTCHESTRARRTPSLSPQRFNRIEPRGAHRRIQTEEQPDDGRDADAEDDRPDFDGRRNRRQVRD